MTGSQSGVTTDERIAAVNELIAVIASCGRRFWHHEGRIARVERDDRGKLWWVNDYTAGGRYERLCLSVKPYHLLHRGWPHGGTLRELAIAMRDFIRTGEPFTSRAFGPWPTWVCGDGDRWGYGLENMTTIREAAIRLGVSKEPETAQAINTK